VGTIGRAAGVRARAWTGAGAGRAAPLRRALSRRSEGGDVVGGRRQRRGDEGRRAPDGALVGAGVALRASAPPAPRGVPPAAPCPRSARAPRATAMKSDGD